MQTVLPLSDSRAIKLTTALYFTPNGRSIQAEGIVPDIVVERATITAYNDPQQITEADLSGHLGNGNGESEKGRHGLTDSASSELLDQTTTSCTKRWRC